MSEPKRCEKCGGPLPVGALGGQCPRCLLDAGLLSEVDIQRTMTVAPTSADANQSAAEQRLPTTIARYRIVRLIGEGGMGAVYEAEQDQPRRTVALKIIKPGMASPALLRRFEQEAQALGRLQHPGIAQIYEAGTADTGFGPQPYFAMEFIRGSSLKDYVKEHNLSTRDRMEMMAKVADAVHHAHQRGLIHRDLKPGNILVDETGQPKILDFGVARVTDRDAQATSSTDVGQLIGTLAYMSPEQVLADPLELDTRSDVYALGVILYELLADRLPYNIGNKLHEALHAIREEDPARLSSVSHNYKGDIETIVAKALEKDKTRRYSSAADFAADIRRYLTDEPIEARPPSVSYQLQKFAHRHKAVVAGVAAVFVVLVAGIVVSASLAAKARRAEQAAVVDKDRALQAEQRTGIARDQAVQAQQTATAAEEKAKKDRDQAVTEKQRADTEKASEAAVSTFWQQNLVAQAKDGNISMRAALDQAAAKIKADDKNPLVEAKVRESVALAYVVLAAFGEVQEQTERALAIRRRVQGEEHPDTLKTMTDLAGSYLYRHDYASAESLLTRIVEIRQRTQGAEHPDTLSSLIDLSQLYQLEKNPDKAADLQLRIVQVSRRVLGPEHRDTLKAMILLASTYIGQRKFESAGSMIRTVVATSHRAYGDKDSLTKTAEGVQRILETATRLLAKKTAPTADEIAGILPDLTGSRDFSSIPQMISKTLIEAQQFILQGKYGEAVEMLNSRLDIARRAGVENTTEVGLLRRLLAESYSSLLKYPEAESNYVISLDIQRRTSGLGDPGTLSLTRALANLYRMDGKFSEAEPLFVQLVESMRRSPGEEDQVTRNDMALLAMTLAREGKFKQSEDMFTQTLALQRRYIGPEALNTISSISNISWVRLRQQQYSEAETTLREAAGILDRTASDAWERFGVQSLLGSALAGQKRYAEAESLLVSGYEGMRQHFATTAPTSLFDQGQAGEAILKLYQDWGKPEKVTEWKNKLQGAK